MNDTDVLDLAACVPRYDEPRPYQFGGRTRYSFSCATCGVPCADWTKQEARERFEAHRDMEQPPASLLTCIRDTGLTKEMVKMFPDYFISGPGRQIASRTDCGHGYWLTDSCPRCP